MAEQQSQVPTSDGEEDELAPSMCGVIRSKHSGGDSACVFFLPSAFIFISLCVLELLRCRCSLLADGHQSPAAIVRRTLWPEGYSRPTLGDRCRSDNLILSGCLEL